MVLNTVTNSFLFRLFFFFALLKSVIIDSPVVISTGSVLRGCAETVIRGQNPSQQMTDCFSNTCTVMQMAVFVCPDCSVCLGGRKWAKADSSSRVLFTDERQLCNIVYHLPARLRTCLISFSPLFSLCLRTYPW